MSKERQELLSVIERLKSANQFENYIEYIRFPFYKGLKSDSVINFDFPLTVLVGKNGLGKSSCLQAIYGAPAGYNVSNFWFSTQVDPILEADGSRNCFIYAYRNGKGSELLEVLKSRIKRKGDPDYWETSRPIAKYGMKTLAGKRNPAIKMNVEYLDFRSMLTAFDKYLYFGDPSRLKSSSKQDYLRIQSKKLKKVLANGKIYNASNNRVQNKKAEMLRDDDIADISTILGKQYTCGQVVEHKLFSEWGYSILFSTNGLDYSEAFAGSGESAVSLLVYMVNRAQPGSLIILDEPEVSLHPGAQRELINYLLKKIKELKVQVVLSTHSPVLSEDLPLSAVKTFIANDGRTEVVEGLSAKQAFACLGARVEKSIVYVEDDLAKRVLDRAIAEVGNGAEQLLEVTFEPGGASNIFMRIIPILSRNRTLNSCVYFDGDQNFGKVDLAELPEKDINIDRLNAEIKKITGLEVDFYPDGGKGGAREDQGVALRREYIDYHHNNVFYFPTETPEELLWGEGFPQLFRTFVDPDELAGFEEQVSNLKAKDRIKAVADKCFGGEVGAVESLLIAKVVSDNGDNWQQILRFIKERLRV